MSGDGMDRSGEGRLARWSRLKRETQIHGRADPVAAPVDVTPGPDQRTSLTPGPEHPVAHEAPGEEKTPADLPPIESLDRDSDYTPFLREGVPEDLKRQALRKLWSSDPAFMETDPYNVYNDDFTKFVPIDAAKDTAYKIGHGFCEPEDLMTDEEKEAARRAKEAADKTAVGDTAPAGAEGKTDTEQTHERDEPSAPAGQLTRQETAAPGPAGLDVESPLAAPCVQAGRVGAKLPDSKT